ncbi:MAG: hypothetical protein Q9P01_06460 [Anaerolineae bacterium]|nr:hypothetical protein [Anaerolineae bacterium]MDQ7034474.1 hypothetical protein [Anaerolineae bacterium]
MKNNIHRWFFIPAILILIGAFMLLTGRITIETTLPLQTISMIAAAVAGLVVVVTMGLEARTMAKNWQLPEPEEPPTTDKVIYPTPLDDTMDSLKEADKFSKRATERVRIEIDIEDARDD